MNKMELENAVKSIFLHCLNEEDVLWEMKNKLNDRDGTYKSKECQTQRSRICFDEDNDSMDMMLLKKMDEMLSKQIIIENMIKSKTDVEIKKEYELQINSIQKQSEKEIGQYKEKLKDCQKCNKNLTIEKEKLKNENDKLIIENENMKIKYTIFDELSEIWNCINMLNADNREYINGLCGGSDILAVLSLGRDDNRIAQLWSYLRDLAVKLDVDKEEILKINKYFEFCLEVANSTKLENDKYVLTEPVGEFDMDICIRTSDSKQIGEIIEVIVKGVRVGEDVKYKAIVKVK